MRCGNFCSRPSPSSRINRVTAAANRKCSMQTHERPNKVLTTVRLSYCVKAAATGVVGTSRSASSGFSKDWSIDSQISVSLDLTSPNFNES
jgi:hypothetical protein